MRGDGTPPSTAGTEAGRHVVARRQCAGILDGRQGRRPLRRFADPTATARVPCTIRASCTIRGAATRGDGTPPSTAGTEAGRYGAARRRAQRSPLHVVTAPVGSMGGRSRACAWLAVFHGCRLSASLVGHLPCRPSLAGLPESGSPSVRTREPDCRRTGSKAVRHKVLEDRPRIRAARSVGRRKHRADRYSAHGWSFHGREACGPTGGRPRVPAKASIPYPGCARL